MFHCRFIKTFFLPEIAECRRQSFLLSWHFQVHTHPPPPPPACKHLKKTEKRFNYSSYNTLFMLKKQGTCLGAVVV